MLICDTYSSCTIPIHVHVVSIINVTSHLNNKDDDQIILH